MAADFAAVAKEIFQILQTFDYKVKLYNEEGSQVTEPEDARRFLASPKNLMVSLTDDDDDSRITLHIGKSTEAKDINGLIQHLRTAATKYNMVFRAQRYGKNITPREFSQLAAITESLLYEQMYGTSKTSYLRLEKAKLIVKHKNRIDDSKMGARTRCIETILVENDVGERFLFPGTYLLPARAMLQHVNSGGTFADQVGDQIIRMARDFTNLANISQYICTCMKSLPAADDAAQVNEACRCKMKKLRKSFDRLSRSGSYVAETASVRANMALNETDDVAIDETKITELRRLLNDADLPQPVYEAACKAMDEMKQNDDTMTEAVKAPTVSVLGHRVDASAWDELKSHVLKLRRRPSLAAHAFKNAIAELSYRLGAIAPVVEDDSLSNLLGMVAEKLPEETDEDMKRKYRMLAVHALKAVDMMPQPLADKNPVVREHQDWLDRFLPEAFLADPLSDPMADPYDPTAGFHQPTAEETVIDEFDPEDFVDSPIMQDAINGRNPHDPEENHLDPDEIKSALRHYLSQQIELYSDLEADPNSFDAGDDLANEVYDDVVRVLQERGFVVNGTDLAESEELTIEDVLLPSKNQGDDLKGEVTKASVENPDGTTGKPDDAYTSRLMTLSGMNNFGY